MDFKFTLKGVKNVLNELKTLETKIQKSILRKAARAGMKEVVKSAKSRIPVDTGDYRRALTVRSASKGRRIAFRMYVDPDKLGLGEGDHYYVASVEYGNEHQAPQAPLRKTYEAEKDRVAKLMKDMILKGIEDYKAA